MVVPMAERRTPEPAAREAGQKRREPGELKRLLMRALWDADQPMSANQIRELIGTDGPTPALTTVLTVLERMRIAGDLVRTPGQGQESLFAPAHSESEVAASSMVKALVGAGDRAGALVQFSGELSDTDAALLRQALARRTGS